MTRILENLTSFFRLRLGKHFLKLIGLKEIPGHNDEQEIMALYRGVGHKWVEHDEVPWCAAAVGAILKRAGLKYLPTLRARFF